jgi:hypothetical protein
MFNNKPGHKLWFIHKLEHQLWFINALKLKLWASTAITDSAVQAASARNGSRD